MQVANIRELKINTKKVLGPMLNHGPVLLTKRGKPIALMRSLSSQELDFRFAPLWERIKIAAEKAGYTSKSVNRLIASIRSTKA